MVTGQNARIGPFIRSARVLFVVASWGYVVALFVQVYFAALSIFDQGSWIEAHGSLGWLLVFYSILIMPPLAALARVPRGTLALSLALIPLAIIQMSLVTYLRGLQHPMLDALHPVNALLLVLASVSIARGAVQTLRIS